MLITLSGCNRDGERISMDVVPRVGECLSIRKGDEGSDFHYYEVSHVTHFCVSDSLNSPCIILVIEDYDFEGEE